MKNFKKYYLIPASPEELFIAFTNPFTIELWTNQKAIMELEPGTEFSWLDGSISGKTLSIINNKELVQIWDFDGQGENESKVTLRFHIHKNGTSVELNHSNIPDEAFEDIADGWDNVIFENLMDYFSDN